MKHLALVLAAALLLASCSDETTAEELGIEPPVLTMSNRLYATTLGLSGETATPTVEWGGQEGAFSLAGNPTGITLDETTGALAWTELLPLGETQAILVATNLAGSAQLSITFTNEFAGSFSGGYNADPASTTLTNENYTVSFSANGNLSVTDGGSSGSGYWTQEDDTVTGTYTFNTGGTTTLVGEVSPATETSPAQIEGFLYGSSIATEGDEEGYFLITIISGI